MEEKNLQLMIHQVEIALRKIGGKDQYYNKSSEVETICAKYVEPDKREEFLKDLKDLIANPYRKK